LSSLPKNLTRRQFVRLALVSATTAIVEAACRRADRSASNTLAPSVANDADRLPATEPAVTVVATPDSAASETLVFPPLPKDRPQLLRNRNDPHYNVRYARPLSPLDHGTWRLEVVGLIETPGSFSLTNVLSWPQMEQVSRMKCVECWSFKAQWGGFHYGMLAERVKPLPESTHVRVDCADGYWEIVALEELADPRVVFVLQMNGELLLDEYGAPLRLMFPSKYGYKSAKAVTAVTFTDQGGKGYWPSVGPYESLGLILPGYDHPQDLPGEWMPIGEGEITSY
jgi:sulfoxide reductase catalytic subunit YedY